MPSAECGRVVVIEALIQHSEAYSIALWIWALYTVALLQASSLDANLLRAPSLCAALGEMLFICLFHINLLSTVTPRISRSSTSVIMALPKYRSIFVGFLFVEMVNALHLVGSNVTLDSSAHLFMFSSYLLMTAQTASAWLGDLISQNKVASSVYRLNEEK